MECLIGCYLQLLSFVCLVKHGKIIVNDRVCGVHQFMLHSRPPTHCYVHSALDIYYA